MKIHHLKIEPDPLTAIKEGRKKFEWRKDDRNYAGGDLLILEEVYDDDGPCEYRPDEYEYTKECFRIPRITVMRISYKFFGAHEMTPGYCILGIEPVSAQIEDALVKIIRGQETEIGE